MDSDLDYYARTNPPEPVEGDMQPNNLLKFNRHLIKELNYDSRWWITKLNNAFDGLLRDNNVIIAGGFVRRVKQNTPLNGTDVDIFLTPQGVKEHLYKELAIAGLRKDWIGTDRTIKGHIMAFPGNVPCTLILDSPHADAESLLSTFSLTCCQFAVQVHDVIFADQAVEDAERKIMRKVPTATWNMKNLVDKYTSYGFTAVGELAERIKSGEPLQASEDIDS